MGQDRTGDPQLTRAVLGKTKLKKVIEKGMVLLGLQYFHREPTETRKNHRLKPQSKRLIITPTSRKISTD